MKLIPFIFFFLISIPGNGQASYSGFLGSSAIKVVMYHYGDGYSRAFYAYDKYDSPIIVDGNLKNGELILFEKDKDEKITATFVFEKFDEKNSQIKGKWMLSDASKTYSVSLHKDFDISYGDDVAWEKKELIQSSDTKEHYFKTIITKEKDSFYARISGVKILEKGTDKLIQTIDLDCQLFGIDNVSVDDYNFDGYLDFSVFEASYAGPNTSSIYILRDPNSNNYFLSDFSGSSLEFDHESKLVYEHNQCCAGRSHMNATYKVIDNQLVLISQTCLEYDETIDDFVEKDCE